MWISLSIMLADSLTALFIMVFQYVGKFVYSSSRGENENVEPLLGHHETVSTRLWMSGLLLASAFCIVVVNYIFAVPVVDIVLAVGFALFVSVLAVRALGETDLNPVSGIGKVCDRTLESYRSNLWQSIKILVTDITDCFWSRDTWKDHDKHIGWSNCPSWCPAVW